MSKEHTYKTNLNWTGNKGKGTTDYKSYERAYTVQLMGKRTFTEHLILHSEGIRLIIILKNY